MKLEVLFVRKLQEGFGPREQVYVPGYKGNRCTKAH